MIFCDLFGDPPLPLRGWRNNRNIKQAEAEVVPSSSLVEVKVGVEVEIGVGVGVGVDVEVDATFRHSLDDVQILFRVDGVAGEMGIKANLNSSCS